MNEKDISPLEDRDRILSMDRAQLLQELSEGLAEAMQDASTEMKEGWVRDGYPALNWLSTFELREELYELYDDILPEDRRYPAGEKKPEHRTLGKFVEELVTLITETDKIWKDPSEWVVVMRADLDGDVIIGWRIKDINIDGFHQHVNLIGPAPVVKKLDKGREIG